MDPEKWQQIKEIFDAVLRCEAGGRPAFLDEACQNDAYVRGEVESLLASFDDSFMKRPAVGEVAERIVGEADGGLRKGQFIGQYRILAELGKGGQGTVYKAFDEKLNRTVALKTLPPDLNIDETSRKRFRREAQLASALDHPNICTVHDLIEIDGTHFIVMQFIDGKNVRQLVGGRPLELETALKIAIQVCDALATAHHEQIIHRDIKAHNVIVNSKGVARILDFGLAKTLATAADETELTAIGSPYGTPTYAAPEQSRGERVDHRADIFSTGVLLYEMLTGTWAFHGKTAIDVRHAVLYDEPTPVADRRGGPIPDKLGAIIKKALAKDPADRYQQMARMRDDLIDMLRDLEPGRARADEFAERFVSKAPRHFLSRRSKTQRWAAAAAIVVLTIAAGGYFLYDRNARTSRADNDAVRVGALVTERRYFEAYDLARSVLGQRPGDKTVLSLMPVISDQLSVSSNESGAHVYIRRFAPDEAGVSPGREYVGVTPLENRSIARGDYLLEVEKDGFTPFIRTISGRPEVFWDLPFNPPPTTVEADLVPVDQGPDRMVRVPGGDYHLASWKRPTDRADKLSDFFIDRFEVTNREFAEFVSAGGYLKREYWKHPFSSNGKVLTWEAAVANFKDRTGLPGPRSWVNQTYPADRADHPVTDICWYEAAAYADFRGKSLPTVFQWEKAARNGQITQSSDGVMPWGYSQQGEKIEFRANISGRDTLPAASNPFGVSPYGCYNMAGNVAEWCDTETTDGFIAAGGSWGEPLYGFGAMSGFPSLFSSNKLGFRCVVNPDGPAPDRSRIDTFETIPVYTATSTVQFKALAAFYEYDKIPSDGRVTEVVDTADWRRERIEYTGGGDQRAIAYLYLPRNAKPPYQTIEYMPAGDVYNGFITVPRHVETFASSQIKAGRAVFAVVLEGFLEREEPADAKPMSYTSVRYRQKLVRDAVDLFRGMDYLETRDDIDKNRIAYWGYSAGAEFGVIYTSLESRLKTAIFMAVGITLGSSRYLEEANAANFAPHIKMPKLIINGRYDENYSWPSETQPLVQLMTEPKYLVRYDAGHTPPPEIAVPEISKWLDDKLGPVNR